MQYCDSPRVAETISANLFSSFSPKHPPCALYQTDALNTCGVVQEMFHLVRQVTDRRQMTTWITVRRLWCVCVCVCVPSRVSAPHVVHFFCLIDSQLLSPVWSSFMKTDPPFVSLHGLRRFNAPQHFKKTHFFFYASCLCDILMDLRVKKDVQSSKIIVKYLDMCVRVWVCVYTYTYIYVIGIRNQLGLTEALTGAAHWFPEGGEEGSKESRSSFRFFNFN